MFKAVEIQFTKAINYIDASSYAWYWTRVETLKAHFSNQCASFYISIKSEQPHTDPQLMAKLRG